MSDEMRVCGYCGSPLWAANGELSVTSLKATRIDFDKVVDTNIENEVFCDAKCLCNAILEMSWLHDSAPKEYLPDQHP